MTPRIEPFEVLCLKANGRLKVEDLTGFNRYVAQFGDGEEVAMTLEPAAIKGTAKMRKYFHGPVLKGFEELGLRRHEIKPAVMLHFCPQEIRRIDGAVVIVPGHWSDLSKQEQLDLIDAVIQYLAEKDVVIKDGQQWLADQRHAMRESAKKKGAAA